MYSAILPLYVALLYASVTSAQHNTSTANGCDDGFFPGTDTVIFTTPYTYQQVMSIIGSFRNITWSGSPYNTVTLNGTDDTVGTARFYNLNGAHVVETITVYSKPPDGPYDEVHTLSTITLPSLNLSVYGDYDGTTVVPVCNGLASTFNFTIDFCATNASLAAALLHETHLTDAQTVGVFLGGQNFTSCKGLETNATANATASPTASATPSTYTGAAQGNAGRASLWAVLAMSVSVLVLGGL